ncbi:MAG: DegQ family serine endoprotease [Magnetospirillum sp. WYHS-4]
MRRMKAALAGVVALGLCSGAWARPAPEGFADLAEKLLPSVVNVSTTQHIEGRADMPELPQLPPGSPFEDFFKEFFDKGRPQQKRKATSLGSGFVIDAAGHIVTNNHVIQDAEEINVILHDNTRVEAKVVGRDAKTDLAVLKIKTDHKLQPVGFGDSDKARVGDWILAIGNPFGLGGTVTAGIISARGRDINSGPYDDFLQTDASINRGNSGGPMFNLQGEVIGINTAIYSPSGGSVGIGFAIPAGAARPVVEQLIKHGQVKRGWLGVHIQGITEELADGLGLKEAQGALVASVSKGGPAEKAQIQAGDVILEFDGHSVNEMRKLPRMVGETPVGKPVDVVLWRGGKKQTVKVVLGELDDEESKVAAAPEKGGERGQAGTIDVPQVGLVLAAPNKPLRERFSLPEDAKGVVVVSVKPGSPAAEKGFRAGDLISEVNQEPVSAPAQVKAKVDDLKKGGKKSVMFLVQGQGGARFVVVKIDGKD